MRKNPNTGMPIFKKGSKEHKEFLQWMIDMMKTESEITGEDHSESIKKREDYLSKL